MTIFVVFALGLLNKLEFGYPGFNKSQFRVQGKVLHNLRGSTAKATK